MSNVPDISIVVPVYGSDNTLSKLHERVVAALNPIPASFELIFVDDCGPGQPWALINELSQRDSRVIGLKLSRNFGQHNAISAGVDIARGNWIVIMDCDLQDRPEEIPRLLARAREGFDVVVGRRVKRKDSIITRLFSRAYHKFFSYMTDQAIDPTQASFGIYSRKVVEQVKMMPEQFRVFPLMVRWVGFNIAAIEIVHDKRAEGKSSYNLSRKLSLATDAIISYSNKPLRLFIQIGFITAFTAICYGLLLISRYLFFGYVAPGWTSVMVSLFFIFGILLFGMGILGVYIGQIFNQVKGRPVYVVRERTRSADDTDLNSGDK